MTDRLLRVLFAAYITATLAYIGWVVAHEPFTFDAWNFSVDTHARPFSVGRFFDYWHYEYTHSNPRLGQAFAYLAYKLEYFAVIATPLAFLAMTFAITVLGIARWPLRRGRDLALWAIVIGFSWFALPQLGKWMFCRAYGTNYIYSLALQLWFLVPLRLVRSHAQPWPVCIAYALAGVVAGACNEHTGPTLVAGMALCSYLAQRRDGAWPRLATAGTVGTVIGFALIFFAPGQGERYEGLAQKAGFLGRLVQHGFAGNLDILRELLLAAAPTLAAAVLVVALTRRSRDELAAPLRWIVLAAAAATLMALTMFVSPKLGTRFYLAGCALILAGFVALADVTLVTRRALVAPVLVALFASGYAAARTVPLYARAKSASDARIAALEASRPGSVFVADAFDQVEDSWWFQGDDFRDTRKREMVAEYFGLAGVVFRAYDITAPLGVSSARFIAVATTEPPVRLEDHGGFALGSYKGFDLPGIHREMKTEVELLRTRLGSAARLAQLDLEVSLGDPAAVLPRPHIIVARWRPDRFEAYVGQIARRSGNTRELVLPKDLAGSDAEVFLYLVGGEAKRIGTARDAHLDYVPWKAGVYWGLACRADACFVFAAAHHGA